MKKILYDLCFVFVYFVIMLITTDIISWKTDHIKCFVFFWRQGSLLVGCRLPLTFTQDASYPVIFFSHPVVAFGVSRNLDGLLLVTC